MAAGVTAKLMAGPWPATRAEPQRVLLLAPWFRCSHSRSRWSATSPTSSRGT
jgi:hypothetical protein